MGRTVVECRRGSFRRRVRCGIGGGWPTASGRDANSVDELARRSASDRRWRDAKLGSDCVLPGARFLAMVGITESAFAVDEVSGNRTGGAGGSASAVSPSRLRAVVGRLAAPPVANTVART